MVWNNSTSGNATAGDGAWSAPAPNFNATQFNAFVALQFIGLVSAVVLVLTAVMAKNVSRNATWIAFFVSWIVSCWSYFLIVAIRKENEQPPFSSCLAQSVLTYAAQPLTTFTTLSLVVRLFLDINPFVPTWVRSSTQTVLLLVFPYIVYVGMIIVTLVSGLNHRKEVRLDPSGMYCGSAIMTPGRISAMTVLTGAALAVVVEIAIFITLLRVGRNTKTQIPKTMIIRIMVFAVFSLVTICYGALWFIQLRYDLVASVNVVLASVPVAAFLVFGTQVDILTAWAFWKRRQAATHALRHLSLLNDRDTGSSLKQSLLSPSYKHTGSPRLERDKSFSSIDASRRSIDRAAFEAAEEALLARDREADAAAARERAAAADARRMRDVGRGRPVPALLGPRQLTSPTSPQAHLKQGPHRTMTPPSPPPSTTHTAYSVQIEGSQDR